MGLDGGQHRVLPLGDRAGPRFLGIDVQGQLKGSVQKMAGRSLQRGV